MKKMMKDKVSEKIQYFEYLSNPIRYVPTAMFFTKGIGIHKDQLTSFELALRDAKRRYGYGNAGHNTGLT
jgi:hypothetical protein